MCEFRCARGWGCDVRPGLPTTPTLVVTTPPVVQRARSVFVDVGSTPSPHLRRLHCSIMVSRDFQPLQHYTTLTYFIVSNSSSHTSAICRYRPQTHIPVRNIANSKILSSQLLILLLDLDKLNCLLYFRKH